VAAKTSLAVTSGLVSIVSDAGRIIENDEARTVPVATARAGR
jgi:hypothetical protein